MSSDQDWVPLWTVADEVRNVVDPAALGSSVVHYSVPSVELTGSGTMESSSDIRSAKQRLHGHEVLISKLNPRKSRVVLVEPHELPIVGSTEFVAIRAKRIDCRFLAYFLSSEVVRTQLESVVQSVTRSHQRASPHEIMRLRVPLPTGSEQRRIAVFLDSEVAKLQALRTGYLKSGQLARERDLAVIRSQLVDADGCSTGASLSWPPAHPVHWRVTPLRYLSRIQRGASPRPIDDPKYFDDQGSHAWVRIADVSASRKYLTGTTQRLSVLGKSLSVALEPGELFVSIAASVGKPIITTIPCCIHDGFVAIRRLVGLDVEFVYYLLLLGDMFRGLGKLGTQLNLNSDTIGSIKMPVPPMVEQQELVRRFRANSEWTSSMQAMVERQLRTLDERLQSVITAAVTGQIDVSTARGVSV